MAKGMASYHRAPIKLREMAAEAVTFLLIVLMTMVVCYVIAPNPHPTLSVSYLPEQSHE